MEMDTLTFLKQGTLGQQTLDYKYLQTSFFLSVVAAGFILIEVLH